MLELRDIPCGRVYDSAFWLMLMRMTAFPRSTNGATLLYERLLPFLNTRPILANVVDGEALRRKGIDVGELGLGSAGGVVWRDETYRGDPSLAQVRCSLLLFASLLLSIPVFAHLFVSILWVSLFLLAQVRCSLLLFASLLLSIPVFAHLFVSILWVSLFLLAQCVEAASHQLMLWLGATRVDARLATSLMMRIGVCQQVIDDVAQNVVGASDALLLTTAAQQLARAARVEARDRTSSVTKAALLRVHAMVATLSDAIRAQQQARVVRDIIPVLDLEGDSHPDAAKFAHVGQLRVDCPSVECLAGDARAPPILRPVELTLVPDEVQSFADVATTLRHAVQLCTLLANQSGLMKNTAAIRTALIQHVFTEVLPLPLPLHHPQRALQCFWSTRDMRYETQADILRLLGLVARHFSTASLSLKVRCFFISFVCFAISLFAHLLFFARSRAQVTRSFDAARILTMSCIATVTDCVVRKIAVDIPSQFSLHYSGEAAGPVEPFCFEIGGYAFESENLMFTEPALVTARMQVLDYFEHLVGSVPEHHRIFRFADGMHLGKGDVALLGQLSLQVGFDGFDDVDQIGRYFTGTDSDVVDNFPEFEFLRDIVFLFKALQSPTSDALPPVLAWKPRQAALRWAFLPSANPEGRGASVRFLLCTVTFYANHAHNLTRSP